MCQHRRSKITQSTFLIYSHHYITALVLNWLYLLNCCSHSGSSLNHICLVVIFKLAREILLSFYILISTLGGADSRGDSISLVGFLWLYGRTLVFMVIYNKIGERNIKELPTIQTYVNLIH